MKLKDFFAFKDWLSYRQKVGLLVIAGVVCGPPLTDVSTISQTVPLATIAMCPIRISPYITVSRQSTV